MDWYDHHLPFSFTLNYFEQRQTEEEQRKETFPGKISP